MATEEPEGKLILDFLDPLFAVAIHISLAEGVMKTRWYESWHRHHGTVPVFHRADGFNLGVLVLGYFVVVTSWLGYHRSVATKPIRLRELSGAIRFVVDIILLFAYCVILAQFENFTFVLWTLTATFGLFVVWDQGKRLEYPPEQEVSARRRGVTVVWFLMYALLASLEACIWPRSWTILTVAAVGTILYRLHKAHPWVPCEQVFCFPFPKATH